MKKKNYISLGIGLGAGISLPFVKNLFSKLKINIQQKDKGYEVYQDNDNVNLFI